LGVARAPKQIGVPVDTVEGRPAAVYDIFILGLWNISSVEGGVGEISFVITF